MKSYEAMKAEREVVQQQVVEAKKYERGEVLKAVQYCAKNVVLLPEC